MPRDLSSCEVFVIGTSAGGIDILNKILPAFKKTGKYKVCVVIHLPPAGPNLIPELMSERCALSVTEAVPGEHLEKDHIYVSPPDYHLCIEPNGILTLSTEAPVHFSRPSIDILFESAAYALGKKVVGLLFTGANNDGATGLKKIQEAGGVTIVQNPLDAEFETMPQSALDMMNPDYVLSVNDVVKLITDACENHHGR